MARPTKYKKEYCEMLIEHMSNGYSFEAFGAVINVNQDTLHEWVKVHPAFSEAKKMAYTKNRAWWEREAAKGLWSDKDGPTLNTTLWIFNMKNRFKWTDRHEVTKDVKDMDEEEFNILAAKVVERIKNSKE